MKKERLKLSKLQRKKSNKYVLKTNKSVYLFLLIVSIMFLTITLFVPINSKLFTIISGIGCGGIASVFVAWLIDITNCKHINDLDDSFLSNFFYYYEIILKKELSTILYKLAKKNPEIDIYNTYNILDIEALLDFEEDFDFLERRYSILGKECYRLDESLLLSNYYSNILIKVYSIFHLCKRNYESYQSMKNNMSENEALPIAVVFLRSHLIFFAQINDIRNNNIEIKLSQEEIKIVKAYRAAIKKK